MSVLGAVAGLASSVLGFMSSKAQASAASNLNKKNREFNAQQAEIQRNWEVEQAQKTMDWNAQQAALNRDWESNEALLAYERELNASSTAHQREVADLRAAGLNPILSANSGASGVNAPMASSSAPSMSAPSGGAAATANGASNTSQPFDIAPILNSALNYDIEDRRLNIEQQRADNDSIRAKNDSQRVSIEERQASKQIEKLDFDIKNSEANTEVLKAQATHIYESIINEKVKTKAEATQMYAIANQANLVGVAQANYLNAQQKFVETQDAKYEKEMNSFKAKNEEEMHKLQLECRKLPQGQAAVRLGTFFNDLLGISGAGLKAGGVMLRK